MAIESRLIPALREGVELVKMIFFMKLKAHLNRKYPQRPADDTAQLCAAIVNEVFGTPNMERSFTAFVSAHHQLVEEELRGLAASVPEMLIPLTDALRIQFLCDEQEGIDSSPVLLCAEKLKILLVEREVPLPAPFMNLVRTLGVSLGLLEPPRR
jgi:hypothetical protein